MTFQEFLKQKADQEGSQERREQREEWLAAVSRLLNQVRDYLRDSDPEGILELVPIEIQKVEPNLGVYNIAGLKIRLGEATVEVLPIGRHVVGTVQPQGQSERRAEGRVDITDGVRKSILYRTCQENQERWYALDEQFRAAPFDQKRLEVILQDLLS